MAKPGTAALITPATLCLIILGAALAPPVHAQVNVVVNGRPALDDTIVIDETTDGADADAIPGVITVNGVEVRNFDGTQGNTFRVNTLGGNDTVMITDNDGNDTYEVHTGDGTDMVTITDGDGNDGYGVQTGTDDDTVGVTDGNGTDGYNIDTGGGRDAVTVTDGGNGLRQSYVIRTHGGFDTVDISDGTGEDAYGVDMGGNDDVLEIEDFAGRDLYDLRGGPHGANGDTLRVTDLHTDNAPNADVVAQGGFETVTDVDGDGNLFK